MNVSMYFFLGGFDKHNIFITRNPSKSEKSFVLLDFELMVCKKIVKRLKLSNILIRDNDNFTEQYQFLDPCLFCGIFRCMLHISSHVGLLGEYH